jgi:hypothetical protein
MLRDLSHPFTRSIERLGVETPLIVPSFSSRGFPELAVLYDELRNDLYGVCLVSAFDMSTRRLAVELGDVADLVVLDSGVYETKPIAVAADGYQPPPANDAWARDSYRTYLESVGADVNILAVSFDHYGSIDDQIAHAMADFALVPTAASDFLAKPPSIDTMLDSGTLRERAHALSQFRVLGVTERELGGSLLDRCRALIGLRDALSTAATNLPIHVFGTITPGAILAYFLCGADIFDGLNWLRFVYDAVSLRPIGEAALDEGEWDQPDGFRFLRQSRRNLRFLRRLQDAMRSYCRSGDLEALAGAFPVAKASARVAAAAGGRFAGARST